MTKLPASLKAKRDELIAQAETTSQKLMVRYSYEACYRDIIESPEMKDLAEEAEVLLKKQALIVFAEEPEHIDHLLKDLTKALATWKAWVGNE